ncbi:hypothetical protein Z043_121181 [Scleropages formosus]|uniref:Cadherin domain-containing protein n=1 Tax=Scleropages formosus TaxID=113540 RepID=A0A0P7TIQ9_SCLFO|nr:hypothetical protein Z043_121181 [Scleropages formosus]
MRNCAPNSEGRLERFPSPRQVTVTDGGPAPRHSTVWVVVHVLDENDNKPQFPEKVYQIKLPERDRRRKGEPIYRVFAFDRDQGSNAELSYSIVDGNEDAKFFIDPKTAVVSSRKQFTAGSYDILTVRTTSASLSLARSSRWAELLVPPLVCSCAEIDRSCRTNILGLLSPVE